MGDVSDSGQVRLNVEVGAVGKSLLGGDGEVGVVRAHHPAVLERQLVRVAGLRFLNYFLFLD